MKNVFIQLLFVVLVSCFTLTSNMVFATPILDSTTSNADALNLNTSDSDTSSALRMAEGPNTDNATTATLPMITNVASIIPPIVLPTPITLEQITSPQVQITGTLGELNTSSTTTTNAENAATTNTNSKTPNDKASENALIPFGSERESSPFVHGFLLVGVALFAIALLGFSLVKFKNNTKFTQTRQEKPMQIVSNLAIGSKRQLLLIRVRDKEILITSTEQGITMLTEVNSSTQNIPLMQTAPSRASNVFMNEPRHISATNTETSVMELETKSLPSSNSNNTSRKSDFLLKALNNLKDKNNDNKSDEPNKKAAFPKYFAKTFEEEAKREIGNKVSNSQKYENNSEDNVESVTRMIREKLKNLNPQQDV